MIKVTNLATVNADLDAWIKGAEILAMQTARGIAIESFKLLLDHSAQYSGDFAANWRIGINGMDYSFVPFQTGRPGKLTVYSLGDRPAIDVAFSRNAGKLGSLKMGDTVFISNSSSHDQAYAGLIESSQIAFRPVNYGRPIYISQIVVKDMYGGVISPAKAAKLGAMTL